MLCLKAFQPIIVKKILQHFGVKGDGKLELEIKPFAAFNEKPAIVAFDAP